MESAKKTQSLKQAVIGNFFKSKSGANSDVDSSSDNESVYLPSKTKRIYDQPMSWTRVKEVAKGAT